MCTILQCVGGAIAVTARPLDSKTIDRGFAIMVVCIACQILSAGIILHANGDFEEMKAGSRKSVASAERRRHFCGSCVSTWLVITGMVILRPWYRLAEVLQYQERSLKGDEHLWLVLGSSLMLLAGPGLMMLLGNFGLF